MGQYQAVSHLSLPAETTRQVWLEGVEFPLHLVKQVFTNEDSSIGILYLVTSDLTLYLRPHHNALQKKVERPCLP